METTSVHRDNEPLLNVVFRTLDQLHIPAGTPLQRLASLKLMVKMLKQALEQATTTQYLTMQSLTTLGRQMSLQTTPWTEDQVNWVRSDVARITTELAKLDPDYMKVEAISALVETSQELLESTDEMMLRMRGFIPHNDPDAKKLNDIRARLSHTLAKARSKQFYGEKR